MLISYAFLGFRVCALTSYSKAADAISKIYLTVDS